MSTTIALRLQEGGQITPATDDMRETRSQRRRRPEFGADRGRTPVVAPRSQDS